MSYHTRKDEVTLSYPGDSVTVTNPTASTLGRMAVLAELPILHPFPQRMTADEFARWVNRFVMLRSKKGKPPESSGGR